MKHIYSSTILKYLYFIFSICTFILTFIYAAYSANMKLGHTKFFVLLKKFSVKCVQPPTFPF